MTPQLSKIEPLVVMNLFWAWWGKVVISKGKQLPQTPVPRNYEPSNCSVVARCQHFLLSCSATFWKTSLILNSLAHWLTAEVQFHQTCGRRYRTSGSCSLLLLSPPGYAGGHSPCRSSCGRHDLSLCHGRGGATRPEAAEDGHRALPFHRLQQLLRAHSLTNTLDVFMDGCLELSSMEPQVWGFWVVLQCKY